MKTSIPGNPGLTISTDQYLAEVRAAIADLRSSRGENIIQVWYCKTIQNHKGLFITDAFDGHFYECTYNGDQGELYVDDYVKRAKHTVYNVSRKGGIA